MKILVVQYKDGFTGGWGWSLDCSFVQKTKLSHLLSDWDFIQELKFLSEIFFFSKLNLFASDTDFFFPLNIKHVNILCLLVASCSCNSSDHL